MREPSPHRRFGTSTQQSVAAILCLIAFIVALLLSGCQSPLKPSAAGPSRSEILPLGWLQTLTGRTPALPELEASNPAPIDITTSDPASESPVVNASATEGYPVARWLNNEKLIPSNDRDWIEEHKVLPTAEYAGDLVTVHNVRNAEWLTAVDCIVERNDRTYNLKDLESLDFVVVPFENKTIAHTMLSFGFGQGTYLGVSAEVRVEKGEGYNAALGVARQFELTYVLADEHDLLPVRVKHRKADVYIYRTTATPLQSQKMFKDVLARVNQLARTPEFYDTLSNNCTTNIVRHVNALSPNRVPYDARVLLPGYADHLAYELGLLDQRLPFQEIKRRAWSNDRIVKYEHSPDFSARIRK